MKQVRTFNRSNAGKQAGWCLRNVRMGYGIAPVYASAWDAWNGTPQKRNRTIPTNVDVPLYYDYTDRAGNRYGHINVRLKDGRIWNDGNYFSSLSAFEKAWANVKYVGWSTHVNNVQVIKEKTVSKNLVNNTVANISYRFYIGTAVSDWGKKNAVGKMTPAQLQKHLRESSTYARIQKQAKDGTLPIHNHLPTEIRGDVKQHLDNLKQATDSLSKQRQENERLSTQIKDKTGEIEVLQDDVANLKNETNQLKAEIKEADKEYIKLEKENKRLQDEVKSQDGTLTALGHLRMAIRKALHLQ